MKLFKLALLAGVLICFSACHSLPVEVDVPEDRYTASNDFIDEPSTDPTEPDDSEDDSNIVSGDLPEPEPEPDPEPEPGQEPYFADDQGKLDLHTAKSADDLSKETSISQEPFEIPEPTVPQEKVEPAATEYPRPGLDGFRQLTMNCVVHSQPKFTSASYVLKAGRTLWVEQLNENWFVVYKRKSVGFMNPKCFSEIQTTIGLK